MSTGTRLPQFVACVGVIDKDIRHTPGPHHNHHRMALLALGWSCTGLGVTVAVRRVPVLRHAQRTGTQAHFASKVFVAAVDSVRDGVLPDPLALSEVVGLPEIMLRQALAALYRISWRCLRFSSSTRECSSSWTRLSSCPLRADSAGVQACRKLWCAAVALLDKVDMPVVATTGAVLEPCGDARCCDDRCVWVSTSRKL